MKLALLIACGLFIALLLFRFVRGVMLGRRISAGRSSSCDHVREPELARILEESRQTGKTREALRRIEALARSTDAPSSRAAYHCSAGDLSLSTMKRPNVAVGFYLRALREDPTCVPALDKLQEILLAQKRYRRFERTCWEVLSRLDDAEVGSPMWLKCWSGLATVYTNAPRFVGRADAIRAMIAAVALESDVAGGADADDRGEDDEPQGLLPRVGS